VTGTMAIPNQFGLNHPDIVGGTVPGARNIISGNAVDGVSFAGVIQGNYIGTDITGTIALGNGRFGVNDSGASTLVGGPTTAARNIISGNANADINGATGTVENNFIGTDVTGEVTLENSPGSAGIFNASDATILDNLISTGYQELGIRQPVNSVIQGNLIGTNKEGTAAIGNSNGILLLPGSVNNTIGGSAPGQGNVISGNSTGILFEGPNSGANFNDLIEGNLIGTNASGTAFVPGSETGVQVEGGVSGVTIGGTAAGSGNVIAGNSEGGVFVDGGGDPAYGISILGNSIYGNMNLGISLGSFGVTVPNDTGDADTGANNLQNFPVLKAAYAGGASTITGTFNSTPNSTFRLEFFTNPAPDPSGYGQGQTYLGYLNVSTDGSGNATFLASGLAATSAGQWVSATATAPNGSTSDFAQDAIVTLVPTTTTVNSSANPSVFGQCINFTATIAPAVPGLGTPTGTVTFYDGMTAIGTATLAGGSAILMTNAFAVGGHTITAKYSGDSTYDATGADPVSTAVPFAQTVNPAATVTAITSAANPWVIGQPVTFTAVVSVVSPGGGEPQGSVVFKNGSSILATVPLGIVNGVDVASFTTASLPVGTEAITATYVNSDGNDLASTGSLSQVILGPGVYAFGTELVIVGADTADYAQIIPVGSNSDGTTGLQVNSSLNGVWSAKSFSQTFSSIAIFGYSGNDNFQLASSLTLPTSVFEGNGNNYIALANGNDTVTLGAGSNRVFGGTGNKTITTLDLVGTSSYIQLGLGNETISLGAGNDQIVLGGGTDVVTAGNGNDAVTTGNGNNTVTLGNGNNYIHSGTGTDAITLGSWNENVQLGDGNKTVIAGGGNNYVHVGTGTDSVVMGSGSDNIQLGGGTNSVILGDGNDYVSAGNGNNTVMVGNGNDNTQLGDGDNVVIEGNGTDYVSVGNGDNLVVGGLGQHTIQVGNGSNILIDGSATVTGAVPNDSFRAILMAWKGGASAASLRPRLSVTYNVNHPSYLSSGSGRDWFFYTYAGTTSNKKPGDSLN
jgi:hypothetical protein